MSSNMGAEHISTHMEETLKADPDTFGESKLMGIGSNDPPIQHLPVLDMKEDEPMASTCVNLDLTKVETSVSGPMSFTFEPEGISFQPSVLADSQSLMTRLQPLVPHGYSVERSLAACRSPRSFQLTGKRKSPPESTLGGSASEKLDAPNKRVESVHNRPWLEQFSSASIRPAHMPSAALSPKTEHRPMPAKKARQMQPASQRKQVMSKKQTGPSQGSTKTQNEGNESLRSKMKESLAATLALVQEHEESPKEKKNSETDEASVPVAESNGPASACGVSVPVDESNEPASACGVSVPVDEGITPALSTRDENSEQKDANGIILSQESSNDTKLNYVNEADVQKTQFDEVFPCDDVPFSDSILSGDELLQGNGLSWVLEPVSDLGEKKENETADEKLFEDPDLLASEIELELFKLFGGVNKKYKEKGRSLLFNLKDKNNPELRESVMSGKISPERLCSMTAEELASKELSQWRQAKAEEMAEMVVLRDADIDVSRLVRKTHKGEFHVEIDPVDSEMVDVSAGITSRSKPRAKAKSMKSSNLARSTLNSNKSNDHNTNSDQGAMTLPSTEETDPMQGLSMDDEMKDVGFLPPIVSLDEFMESLNAEPPFASLQHGNAVKEEVPACKKSDPGVGPHSKSPSRSPKQSPKEPCESVSPETEAKKTIVTSPKPDVGVKHDVDVSKPEEAPLVGSVKEDQIWDGILQLSVSSVVSVTGIFKSGEKAKTSEWPTLVEVKGRVRLSAFGKFVQELPMSRSRVLMVINVECKDGVSQSQRDSLFEVAKSYVADQRVGYAEPTSGVELYLCPSRGETLDLLGKIISKDHLDEAKCSDNIGLIGVFVWRRAAASPASRHKPGFKRQHSSSGTKSSVLAPESKKYSSSLNVKNQLPVVDAASMGNHGLRGCEDDDDEDLPPGFGPAAAKDDDDLPEFNFNSSTAPVTSSPRPAPQSRSLDQVRELILKYGNSAGSASKRPWDDHDDDDDIPEWQPQVSGHQIQPPPPPLDFRTESGPQFHSRIMARPPAQRPDAGPSDGWRANQNAPRQQQYSARRNRGF